MTVAFKEVESWRREPPWVGQSTRWNIMRKSTLRETNLGPEHYAHCNLRLSGKLSNDASYLRDIKDSGQQICIFLYLAKNLRGGEIIRNLLYIFRSFQAQW